MTGKEFLAVVFGFEEFKRYLIGSYVVVFTDHDTMKQFFKEKDVQPKLIL